MIVRFVNGPLHGHTEDVAVFPREVHRPLRVGPTGAGGHKVLGHYAKPMDWHRDARTGTLLSAWVPA